MNMRDWRLRVRAIAAPRRVERELHEELEFHIERDTQKHLAGGLSHADARARALAWFGPVPLVPTGAAIRAAPRSSVRWRATSATHSARSAAHRSSPSPSS